MTVRLVEVTHERARQATDRPHRRRPPALSRGARARRLRPRRTSSSSARPPTAAPRSSRSSSWRPTSPCSTCACPGLRGLEVVEALVARRLADPRARALRRRSRARSSTPRSPRARPATGPRTPSATRSATRSPPSPAASACSTRRLQSGVFAEIHAREVDSERPVLTAREHEILQLHRRRARRHPRSAPSSTSAPRRSRPTSPTSTRSSASATAPPRSRKRCAAGCWNSEPCWLTGSSSTA